MWNQAPIVFFYHFTVFGLLKRLNGSDYANSAHRRREIIIYDHGIHPINGGPHIFILAGRIRIGS